MKPLRVHRLHGFPEMTRHRWRVSTQKSPFGLGFRDLLRGLNQIAWRPGLLLQSLSILRVAVVNADGTKVGIDTPLRCLLIRYLKKCLCDE